MRALALLPLAAVVVSGCGGGGGGSRGAPGTSVVPGSTSRGTASHPNTTATTTTNTVASPSTSTNTSTTVPVVAGWLPYWSSTGAASVKKNVGAGLDEVNAFWYGVSADGALVAKKGARDVALAAAIHNNKGILVPTVFDVDNGANARAVIGSAALRAKLLKAIVTEVDVNHYDGIDLDFENLELVHRDAFSGFVQQLADEMHARQKIVSIAVLGKLKDKPSWGAAAALDFAALGKSVDRFKIMTYGVHGSWSGPGPISTLDWSERTVKFALQTVPAKKVYLGIPFFGYDWPKGGKASSVTYSKAQTLIAKHGATPRFDVAKGETTFKYVDSGVEHEVWFNDQEGLAAKMALTKKLGIGGVAAWAIIGEGSDFFSVLDKARR